jgi:hypothetical protein
MKYWPQWTRRVAMDRSDRDPLGLSRDGGILDELVQWTAQVHTELLPTDFNEFRKHVSDHIPVTVRVKVVQDDD